MWIVYHSIDYFILDRWRRQCPGRTEVAPLPHPRAAHMGCRGVLLCLLLCATLSTQFASGTGWNVSSVDVSNVAGEAGEAGSVVVTAVLAGDGKAGAALGALAVAVLRRAGLRARVAPPPDACRAAPASRACRDAALAALAAARLHVALLPVPAAAAPAAWLLRDYGLDEFGDATPPARRACLRLPHVPRARVARSLLDLADPDVARLYQVTQLRLDLALRSINDSRVSIELFEPPWCSNSNGTCALTLTSDKSEAMVLLDTALKFQLRMRILSLGPYLAVTVTTLGHPAPLFCDWAPEWTDLKMLPAIRLGPPPCSPYTKQLADSVTDCPFESLRLMKFANVKALARSTAAVRALVSFKLSSEEIRELTARARSGADPDVIATEFLDAHPKKERRGEVRVVVMMPRVTAREAYEASQLAAAAELVEAELEVAGVPRTARLKVELFDDKCDVRQAYKYMLNALGTGEYGALSAVAGPACGGAFAAVARQSPAHLLPVLAYSAQAPAPAAALLAAGDARDVAAALDALAHRLAWRRAAALSEPAARAALDPTRLHLALEVHLDLPDPLPDDDGQIFIEWARRVAAADLRVVVVSAEDARVVRAALCAGHGAGLLPGAGAAWLLPAALPPTWLAPAPADRPACTRAQLRQVAQGHLSFAPHWLAAWRNETDRSTDPLPAQQHIAQRQSWEVRWRARCAAWARRSGGATGGEAVGGGVAGGGATECARAGPLPALLYDTLRLWAVALDRVLAARSALLAALHDPDIVRSLMDNATQSNFSGLTGEFSWVREGAGAARVSPLVLLQWENGTRREVGRWRRSAELRLAALRWRTPDGAPPGDGTDERCALRPLAELLNADCRVAAVTLAALLLVLAMAALAAAALHCKRRAERDYLARLAALSLRTLPTKSDGLDRWEVSRERVVINRKLGMGAFGTVYGGHALLAEDRGWTAVAVKTLKAGATTEEKLDFLSEAETMKRFDHKNIVRLLGVVTKTEPVCTVMEFMLYGDLKNYLLARRHLAGGALVDAEPDEGADEVSPRRLTAMALDAARALSYLAQLRYVHRDVAARNCLVSARRVLKLADFGMTRLVFENDYYRFSRKGMLPVRWMAPESLTLGVFSPASDVWSFGVLLYEIVTFGSLPFQGLSNAEVLTRVKGGHTLELPPGLKPQLEGLIKSCWQREHRSRPSAAQVAALLGESPRLLAPCLDVPLDALPLDAEPPWRAPPDRAQALWLSWTAPAPASAPASAHTDTTYLSSEPRDTDRFLS
ncbi:unnamed protein product [Parnassius apollo]|uniref:(apollo) hypothetical protein n=1 Tax=Parnassius apollo TaxID=110799 RepID=A0A8S3WMB2_PARAO|nr:unnamed protein product [Parnassius apollo]